MRKSLNELLILITKYSYFLCIWFSSDPSNLMQKAHWSQFHFGSKFVYLKFITEPVTIPNNEPFLTTVKRIRSDDNDLGKKCKIVYFIAVMFSERNFWFTSNAIVFHFIPFQNLYCVTSKNVQVLNEHRTKCVNSNNRKDLKHKMKTERNIFLK